MGSVGGCFDNAMAESFFATLECEFIDRRVFRTQAEARMEIFEYIERLVQPTPSSLWPRLPVTPELREELRTGRLNAKLSTVHGNGATPNNWSID